MKTNQTKPSRTSMFNVRCWMFGFQLALVLALATAGSGFGAVLYVDASSASPVPPYTNWATAARVIQDAVDAAVAGDEIVVTNGTYATGGRAVYGTMTNRVAVYKPLTLRSVNGPQSTIIQGAKAAGGGTGDGAVRCVYLTNGASLSGFTLTKGATLSTSDLPEASCGGGVWCESTNSLVSNCVMTGNRAVAGGGADGGTLNNCTLTGNSAAFGSGGASGCTLNNCGLTGNSCDWGGAGGAGGCTLNNCTLTGNKAAYGGGAAGGTLNNCTLTGNEADFGGGASGGTLSNCVLTGNSAIIGGGADGSTLNNCTLTGNKAPWQGGGVLGGTLNNCIVYYNNASDGANYGGGTLNYCCTTPMPTNGAGNITNAPLFVNQAGGNLRLQANSPCINAGNNAYATGPTDPDGSPRIVGGTVDIGAYEFQAPASVISYAWLQQYGLPTDGSADATDPDGDGRNNWQEWRCGTDPTNALSVLRLVSALPAGTDVVVSWQSAAGVSYSLERSTNLGAQPAFLTVATNIAGLAGATTYRDTNGAPLAPLFYRVGVGN